MSENRNKDSKIDSEDQNDHDDDNSEDNNSNKIKYVCPELQNCDINTMMCVHKDIFPMTNKQLAGLLIMGVLIGVAQAGGIGGAPIIIPILEVFNNHDPK